ncbi:MAG: class I SAM-dependent methyltransferase [Nitrospirota bacterium]
MQTVACELCGSHRASEVTRLRDMTHHVTEDEFTIVRCEECGLLYTHPRPSPEEIGRYYPPQYFSSAPAKSRTGVERLLKRLSENTKRWIREDFYGYPGSAPNGPLRFLRKALLWPEKTRRVLSGRDVLPWVGEGCLLDVGCGPGVNLATLQSQGWDVYGIEFSDTAAAQARARVGDRIHTGTLETAPFAESSFDVVLFSHSLEHMCSPCDALARAWRLLKPGGRLMVAAPNAESWERRIFGRWWFPWEIPRHLYHFDKATLTRLLQKAGFQVCWARTAVGSLFFMASLERFWMHRFGRALPLRRLVEKLIARPFCLIAGHLGYGTEITVHAVKREGTGVQG